MYDGSKLKKVQLNMNLYCQEKILEDVQRGSNLSLDVWKLNRIMYYKTTNANHYYY